MTDTAPAAHIGAAQLSHPLVVSRGDDISGWVMLYHLIPAYVIKHRTSADGDGVILIIMGIK